MVVAMVVLCVLVFVNVVLRYGFNSSLLLTEEVARYVFVWLTFLGSILAFARNGHIRVDSGLNLLGPKTRTVVELLADAVILVCCYLITKGSIELAQLNTMNYLPITGMPVSLPLLRGHTLRDLHRAPDAAKRLAADPRRRPGAKRHEHLPLHRRADGRHRDGDSHRLRPAGLRPRAHADPRALRRPDHGPEPVNGADSYELLAIPFFILAGELMNAGGISQRIIDLPIKLVGHLRGGLGYVATSRPC